MIIPDQIELMDWSASLVIDFPNDNIPILMKDEDWRVWGNELVLATSFANNNAPGPNIYTDWKQWATALYFVMANYEDF